MYLIILFYFILFFFHDPATTEIYTLSLHDALPILGFVLGARMRGGIMMRRDHAEHRRAHVVERQIVDHVADRKSTRLNSSHVKISYAVFCLKKKINTQHKT